VFARLLYETLSARIRRYKASLRVSPTPITHSAGCKVRSSTLFWATFAKMHFPSRCCYFVAEAYTAHFALLANAIVALLLAHSGRFHPHAQQSSACCTRALHVLSTGLRWQLEMQAVRLVWYSITTAIQRALVWIYEPSHGNLASHR
jgi:hypothetical protein